jgi:hypothetical protein
MQASNSSALMMGTHPQIVKSILDIPLSSRNDEVMAKVHSLLNSRLNTDHLGSTRGTRISFGSSQAILTKYLGITLLSMNFVP